METRTNFIDLFTIVKEWRKDDLNLWSIAPIDYPFCNADARLIVHEGVTIGEDCRIASYVILKKNAWVGDHVDIPSHTTIDRGIQIGSGEKNQRLKLHSMNYYLSDFDPSYTSPNSRHKIEVTREIRFADSMGRALTHPAGNPRARLMESRKENSE